MPGRHRHHGKGIERAYHPIHDSVFGPDDELKPMNDNALPGEKRELELELAADEDEPRPEIDDTPPYTDRREVNLGGTAAQPKRFQPMRNVGDTDQGDRQPDGGRRR